MIGKTWEIIESVKVIVRSMAEENRQKWLLDKDWAKKDPRYDMCEGVSLIPLQPLAMPPIDAPKQGPGFH